MKLNTAITICYFIYLSIAVALNPVRDFADTYNSSCKNQKELIGKAPVAEQKAEILHSELLLEDF